MLLTKDFLKHSKKALSSDHGFMLDKYLSTANKTILYKEFDKKLVLTAVVYKDTDTWVGVNLFVSDIVPLTTSELGHGSEENWLVIIRYLAEYLKSKGEPIDLVWLQLEKFSSLDEAYQRLILLLDKFYVYIQADGVLDTYKTDASRFKKIRYLKQLVEEFRLIEERALSEQEFRDALQKLYPEAVVNRPWLKDFPTAKELAYQAIGLSEMFKPYYERNLKVDILLKNNFITYFMFRTAIPSGDKEIDETVNMLGEFNKFRIDHRFTLYSSFQTFIEKQYEEILSK